MISLTADSASWAQAESGKPRCRAHLHRWCLASVLLRGCLIKFSPVVCCTMPLSTPALLCDFPCCISSGVDIANVPLQALRTAVSLIPQASMFRACSQAESLFNFVEALRNYGFSSFCVSLRSNACSSHP